MRVRGCRESLLAFFLVCLGISYVARRPALAMVLTRLPAALQLLAASLLVAVMREPL